MSADTFEFSVPGMSCGHCEAAIKQEVGSIGGVSGVIVDLDAKRVVVTATGLDRDIIVEAIGDAGYEVA